MPGARMITNAERAAMRARYENRGSATTSDIASMVCEDVPALLDALDEMERERDALARSRDLAAELHKCQLADARDRARLDGARAMQEAAVKVLRDEVGRHRGEQRSMELRVHGGADYFCEDYGCGSLDEFADEIASIDPATVGTR